MKNLLALIAFGLTISSAYWYAVAVRLLPAPYKLDEHFGPFLEFWGSFIFAVLAGLLVTAATWGQTKRLTVLERLSVYGFAALLVVVAMVFLHGAITGNAFYSTTQRAVTIALCASGLLGALWFAAKVIRLTRRSKPDRPQAAGR